MVATGTGTCVVEAARELGSLNADLYEAEVPGLPRISTPALLLSLGALGVGLGVGELLARHVDHGLARRLAIGLALAGAVFTVVKGAVPW